VVRHAHGAVAVWVSAGIGDAVLCLLGAALFWLVAGLAAGDLDLEDLGQGLDAARSPGGRRPG
jgi:hypothetical protein